MGQRQCGVRVDYRKCNKALAPEVTHLTCGGIFNLNSLELLTEESSDMDMSGNSSQGVLS